MSIASDIQKLEPGAILDFYEIDLTAFGQGVVYHHAGLNELGQPVTWKGVQYQPFPIMVEDIEYSGKGTMPRPKMKVGNVSGIVSQLLSAGDDFVGVRVTRRRTFARYIDAVNFSAGNPSADSSVEFPAEIYFIDRKSSETKEIVEFELAAAFDVVGVQLPRRQIVQNSCPWKYRSPECGYAGGAVATILDEPTTNPSLDSCGKRLQSCKLRFGANSPLPFGGFPAAGLLR